MRVGHDLSYLNTLLCAEAETIVQELGIGRSEGTAYDTAWVARLATKYPHVQFQQAQNWLLENQHADGSWGAPTIHYHDRYISTLASIVSLKASAIADYDAVQAAIKRGENALWHIVGKLPHDDHDTIGFPIISISLTQEALGLGLDVPHPAVRFAHAYEKKVTKLLALEKRNWRENSLAFSLEALRHAVTEDDIALDDNASVAVSLAATAGYLLQFDRQDVLSFILKALDKIGTGAAPALDPLDIFEIAWSISHLAHAGLISPKHLEVKRALDILWKAWSPKIGLSYSSQSIIVDVDDSMGAYAALHWGGYAVQPDILHFYEAEDHIKCFVNETDPSMSAHIRLLAILRTVDNKHPYKQNWIEKIMQALYQYDANGSFWTDKWHVSPYYVNSTALRALHHLDDKLMESRFRWILRTQNSDGGWGYFDLSTPEETAYCIKALLWWDANIEPIETEILDSAADYLQGHVSDSTYTPLWIGKSLYTPYYPVKAVIIGALYSYLKWKNSQ